MIIKLNGAYVSRTMQSMSLTFGKVVVTLDSRQGLISINNVSVERVLEYLKNHGYPDAEVLPDPE
jgi:hypothetical protein